MSDGTGRGIASGIAGGGVGLDRGDGGGGATGTCDECGYDLRGAEPGRPCPECGRVPDRGGGSTVPPGAVWTVSVTAGLGLLLLITFYGVSSVLVQRVDDTFGGALPALNLPGPKLWAIPLLQRPIGRSPEVPGIIGTRTAMLSLLAVWLITTRPPTRSGERGDDSAAAGGPTAEPLRLATRWGSVVVFGACFGVLLSQQGLWPDDLPPYRVMLVCAAELPATVLLYMYLRNLSARLPGLDRRRAFDFLVWAAPAVVATGGAMLVLGWLGPDQPRLTAKAVSLPVAAVYGTAAVSAGVAASAGVAWLAGAYAVRAFPAAWRTLLGTRRWLRSLRASDLASPAERSRVRACAIAAGLVLLPIAMVFGIETVGWFTARRGIAGNLPFYNYPGPKLWAAAAVPELASRDYWEPIVSRVAHDVEPGRVLAHHRRPERRRCRRRGRACGRRSAGARWLRRVVRWLPVLLVGATLGAASVMGDDDPYDRRLSVFSRSELFATVTVLTELPPTVLLYVYLAMLARRFGRARLSAGFLVMAGLLVLLAGAGLSGFVLHWVMRGPPRGEPLVIAASATYGAIVLSAATWAVVAILSLAMTVYATRWRGKTRSE